MYEVYKDFHSHRAVKLIHGTPARATNIKYNRKQYSISLYAPLTIYNHELTELKYTWTSKNRIIYYKLKQRNYKCNN